MVGDVCIISIRMLKSSIYFFACMYEYYIGDDDAFHRGLTMNMIIPCTIQLAEDSKVMRSVLFSTGSTDKTDLQCC